MALNTHMFLCRGCAASPLANWLFIGGFVVLGLFAYRNLRREFRRHPDPRRKHWWAWWTQALLSLGGGVAGIFLGGWGYAVAMGIPLDEPLRVRGNAWAFIGAALLGGVLVWAAGLVLSLFIVRRRLTVEETLDLGEYISLQPRPREMAIASREPTRRLLNWLGLGEAPGP